MGSRASAWRVKPRSVGWELGDGGFAIVAQELGALDVVDAADPRAAEIVVGGA